MEQHDERWSKTRALVEERAKLIDDEREALARLDGIRQRQAVIDAEMQQLWTAMPVERSTSEERRNAIRAAFSASFDSADPVARWRKLGFSGRPMLKKGRRLSKRKSQAVWHIVENPFADYDSLTVALHGVEPGSTKSTDPVQKQTRALAYLLRKDGIIDGEPGHWTIDADALRKFSAGIAQPGMWEGDSSGDDDDDEIEVPEVEGMT